jgi:hypothetical protein
LTKEFNGLRNAEFSDSLKSRIKGKMSGVEHHFRKDWITDWFGIVHLEADWFKEIWSDKELKLMTKIETELNGFGKVSLIKNGVKPTKKLKHICAKLYKQIE